MDTGSSHPAVSGQAFFCHIANKFICLAISDDAAPAAQDGTRTLHGVINPSPAWVRHKSVHMGYTVLGNT